MKSNVPQLVAPKTSDYVFLSVSAQTEINESTSIMFRCCVFVVVFR